MATRPELHIAVAKTKSKASEYNENFTMMMQYVEDSMEDFMPSMTGNSGKILTTDGSTTSWANITTFFQTLYPVGSIYIGTMETCPLASMFGTWTKVSEGRVLQGSDSDHEAGTTIAAGLPNITGSFILSQDNDYLTTTGAFTTATQSTNGLVEPENNHVFYRQKMSFDANKSSSVYGNSTTVQPPAYVVNIWRRTA